MTTNNAEAHEWHSMPKQPVPSNILGDQPAPGLTIGYGGGVEVRVGSGGSQTVDDTRSPMGGGLEVRVGQQPTGATGILATARSALHGTHVAPSELKPSDRLIYQNHELTVAQAERLGLVSRNPNTGHYVEGNAEANIESPPAEPQFDGDGIQEAEPFSDPQAEEFVGALPAEARTAVMNDLASTGTISPGSINALASRLGVEPEQAAKYAEFAVGQFVAQANKKLAQFGIDDGPAFAAWAMANKPSEWKEATKRHHVERSTVGYRPLALAYLSHLHDTDPRAVLAADFGPGVSARMVGKEVVLKIPSVGEVSFKGALKAGLVGPKR